MPIGSFPRDPHRQTGGSERKRFQLTAVSYRCRKGLEFPQALDPQGFRQSDGGHPGYHGSDFDFACCVGAARDDHRVDIAAEHGR